MSSSPSSAIAETKPDLEADATWVNVCLTDDLITGSGICVLFEHKQVAIFYVGNPPAIYAISNHDPFSQANVLSRGIIGSLGERLVVASPIFKQHFCLENGQCIESETFSIDCYHVRIDGCHVQLKGTT